MSRVSSWWRRVLRRLKTAPATRFNVRDPKAAAELLVHLAQSQLSDERPAVGLLEANCAFSQLVRARMQSAGLSLVNPRLAESESGAESSVEAVGCFVLATLDSRLQFDWARSLVSNPQTRDTPIEYIALPHLENQPLTDFDHHRSVDFVAPHMLRHGRTAYEIFAQSLQRFLHKTEIRDYLDLFAALDSLEERSIDGNITEFGSFRGHSGWLISRSLEALGSQKSVFLFDMFEHFPAEDAGVDRFWSHTHTVDFASIQAQFKDRDNVRLVKGDFTTTLAQTDTGPIALAFIDCDSYRATLSVLEQIWTDRLRVGGLVILEDYGHAALLGNRIAAHAFFDGRRDAYTYFSQFSGFFCALKLSD